MTRIDVHHHAIPAFYREHLTKQGITAAGMAIPDWSATSALDIMETYGVQTSILSVSTPGVHLGDDRSARHLARRVNDHVADIVRDHPQHFGLFASVPMPDIEGSVAEIAYAYDELDADGIILLANANGTYVGAPRTEPVLEALDDRAAVVFLHPSTLPAAPVPGVPPYICDFLLDTTRAAVTLSRHDYIRRYPNIRFILAHAGGFLPYAAHRIAFTNGLDGNARAPEYILEDLRTFYFDLAQSSTSSTVKALLDFTSSDKLVFGTDFPHVTHAGVHYFADHYAHVDLTNADRDAISHATARELLPRLKPRVTA